MSANDQTLKAILLGIYEKLENLDSNALDERYLNERYLHHYFSHKVQCLSTYKIDYGNRAKSTFHPERTTKGRYQEENGVYRLAPNGTPGNIDFALGDYDDLEYAIEFKHSQGWIHDPLVFDYMKLLDPENPIQKAISVAVIFRENDLSTKLTTDKVSETIDDLKDRFKEQGQEIAKWPFLFWIIEVAPKAGKSEKIRSWYCNNLTEGFQLVTPPEDPLEKAWFKA